MVLHETAVFYTRHAAYQPIAFLQISSNLTECSKDTMVSFGMPFLKSHTRTQNGRVATNVVSNSGLMTVEMAVC